MSYPEQLGVSPDEADDVLEHFEHHSSLGREYRHIASSRHGIECGTVLIDGTVVRGFPKIPRTLVLSTGIPQQFDGELVVEEKLDGYNVRVARVDDVLAFTRSGYLCPYTTRTVRQRLDLEPFFDDYPETMLCGEMIGPENPYTAHEYPDVETLSFRAFDLRDRVTGEPIPVEERRRICEGYDVSQTPFLGRFTPARAARELPDVVRELDRRGREGVVMKSLDGTTQLKYTTSAANQGALAYAFSLPFEYGREFVFRRIVREAFQSVEWDESEDAARERAHELGESILLSTIDAIRAVEAGETVGEHHTVRGDSDAVDALLTHLRDLGLRITIEEDTTDDGERAVTFCKLSQSTTDSVENYLDGHVVKR